MVPAIEIGRICVKTRGREAGKKCVIVDIVDDNYVVVTGPRVLSGVKRRRVNIKHVEPLNRRIDIGRGASDDEVLKALESAGLAGFMKEEVKAERRLLAVVKAVKEGVS